MELFVESGQNYTFLLELIIAYLKLQERKSVKLIRLSPAALTAIKKGKLNLVVPSLVTPQGDVETEIFQICKRLLQILPQWRTFFFGEGQEANQIAGIKTQLKEGKQLRKHLQKYLQNRTFFVGNHITFADFYMFTHLYDNVIDFTDEQKLQYNNLFRWYKHIQHLPQVKDYLTQSNRFFLQDPTAKVPFLAEKKKPKKEKKEEPKEQKKEEVKSEQPAVVEKKEEQKGQQKVEQKAESQ